MVRKGGVCVCIYVCVEVRSKGWDYEVMIKENKIFIYYSKIVKDNI